jgi:hypothetical protein
MAEILALSIPILLLVAFILQAMARYQIERAKVLGSQEATATAELRKMLEELRETTTQYDLALDPNPAAHRAQAGRFGEPRGAAGATAIATGNEVRYKWES